MRYQKALRISAVVLVGGFLLSSCVNSDMGEFEINQVYEYKLFDLLDNYPALHDALDTEDPNNTNYRSDQCNKKQIRLDQCVVNDLLNDVINEHYDENISYMASQYAMIDSTKAGIPNQYPMQNTIQLMRHLIYRIINQDTMDNGVFDPATKLRTTSALAYAADFYKFLDDISDKNLNLGKELVTIMRAASRFRIDKFDAALMRKEVEFANDDIDATPCQAATYDQEKCNHVLARHKLLTYQQTNIGKSNMLADYPMWLDYGRYLITNWQSIQNGDSASNLGLGNAVQGNQSMMMAVFELVKDSSFRNNLYDFIRQLGFFLSGSVPKQPGSSERIKIADVAENLVRNIESYFTTGGAKAIDNYATITDVLYSSGELRNSLKELMAGTTRLMLRSDRENASLIYEVNGKKVYFADEFIKSLKSIGWDPDNAHIEQSLEDLLRYDQYGRDRTDTRFCGSEDTSDCPYQVSFLESLFFLTAASNTHGWTDACLDTVNGENDPPDKPTTCNGSGRNYGHGHGNAYYGQPDPLKNPSPIRNAGITLNDFLYSMGLNKQQIVGNTRLNLYQMTFADSDYQNIFRSNDPSTASRFTIDGDIVNNIPPRNNYSFLFNQNYPGLYFLASGVHSVLSPNGGRSKFESYIDDYGYPVPVLNSYKSYAYNGLENPTLTVYAMDNAWHAIYNGAGPYYYAPQNPDTVKLYGKSWNIYYRANGKLYALVHKPQGARSDKWEYLYLPNDLTDKTAPVAFYYGKIGSPNRSIFTSSVSLNDPNYYKMPTGATVAQPNGIPLLASESYTFNISFFDSAGVVTVSADVIISCQALNCTLNARDNKFYVDQSVVINAINAALNSQANTSLDACYALGDDLIKIKNSSTGRIVLSDVKQGSINKFLIDPTLEDATSPHTVSLNAVKLDAPAAVKFTIDGKEYPPTTFDDTTIWDRDGLVLYLKDHVFTNPYTADTFGKDSFIISGNPDSTTKSMVIENAEGGNPNAVEILFNGNGNSIVKPLEREEHWSSINRFDTYMGYYCDDVNDDITCSSSGLYKYSTLTRDNNDNIKLVRLSNDYLGTPDKYLHKTEAGGVALQESVDDSDPARACASPEEAFFRNYQWYSTEKKFLVIVPLHIVAATYESGVVYQYFEGNGFYGFANTRPLRGNGLWAKTGKSGRSNIPGDHRVGFVTDFTKVARTLVGITADSMYANVLGGGTGCSSVIVQNLSALNRLAFPVSPEVRRNPVVWSDGIHVHTDEIRDRLVASKDFSVGDDLWNRRNAFMPIIFAALNALRENIDNTRTNTTGYIPFFDTMTILLKPITYFQQGSNDIPHNTWMMRVAGDKDNPSDAYFLKSGGDFYTDYNGYQGTKRFIKSDKWFGSWRERDYFQMDSKTSTLMSVLIDSNRSPATDNPEQKILDGILPLLVAENPNTHERPKVLTQAFKILMNLGDQKFDDPLDADYNVSSQEFDRNFESWGARRKMFYGLEQTMTLSKSTRGILTAINEKPLAEKLPDWMFTRGVNTSCDCMADRDCMPDDMRKEEIFANIDHNILVGSNDYTNDIKPGEPGYQMGLAYLPHDWDKNPDKLTLFHTYLEMASELLKPEGEYSVVENVINVMEKFLSQVHPTNDQLKALVHTLGIMATTYDKASKVWNVASVPLTDGKISFDDHPFDLNDNSRVDDLYRVAGQYQPIINTIALALDTGVDLIFDEGNGTATKFNTSNYLYDSSVYLNGLLKAGGLIEYVLDVVDSANDDQHNFKEIFKELYAFLGEQLFTNFNSTLWNDIAKLMSGQVQVLTRNSEGENKEENFGFQYNGLMSY